MLNVKKLACSVLTATILVGACAALSGCGGGQPEETPVLNKVFVYAQRSNSAAEPAVASQDVVAVVNSGGYVDVVTCDGAPASSIGVGTVTGSQEPNEDNRALENEAQANKIVALLAGTTAQKEEVDLAAAFEFAARSLASAPQGDNELVVIDSGVGTKGDLALSESAINAEPKALVKHLKKHGEIPDLSIIDHVKWYGLGDVEGEQAEVPANTKANLRKLYSSYLKAAGVKKVTFDESVAAATSKTDGLPHVSPVAMPKVPHFKGAGSTAKLTQSMLSFKDGKAAFVDDGAAAETLEDFARALAADSALTVTVKGYTASNPTDPKLSQRRAKRVAKELVALGASKRQVKAKGMGVGPVDDHNGTVERLCAKNRYVELAFA